MAYHGGFLKKETIDTILGYLIVATFCASVVTFIFGSIGPGVGLFLLTILWIMCYLQNGW